MIFYIVFSFSDVDIAMFMAVSHRSSPIFRTVRDARLCRRAAEVASPSSSCRPEVTS